VDRGGPQPADPHGGRTPEVAGGARRSDAALAAAVGLSVFVIYNLNGREIPSSDTQAAKFAAVMLVRHHTLTLDGVVGRVPQYAERQAFQRDREGRWRNGYPLPPVLEAAGATAVLRGAGLLDINAPLAAVTAAKVTASVLATIASVFAFLIARRFCSPAAAVVVALGFALGTGMWPTVSQTLWQHASAVWSTAAAIWLWTRKDGPRGVVLFTVLGVLLGWTLSARLQLLPMVGIMAAGMLTRASLKERAACLIGLFVPVAVFAALNVRWFGHPLGALPQFEQASLVIHRQWHTWQWPWPGIAGLLFSPSRGLIVFSPIVLAALAARAAPRDRSILRWSAAAAAVQFLLYSSYSVWWGGHTYGPRYLLDLLPALLPAASIGVARLARARLPVRLLATAALAWSVTAAATGAFCYPHDQWNTDPVSVDREHARLWDVRDSQILRCWERGVSPQNFALFEREAWRRK
jgi:hypothetical protein